MEERQDNTKNIKILRQRIKEEKVKELLTSAKQAQTRVNSISKLLGEKETELRRKAAEEVAVVETVAEEKSAPVEEPVKQEQVVSAELAKKKVKKWKIIILHY